MAKAFELICAIGGIGLMSCLFIFGYDLITQCDFFRARRIEIRGIDRLDRNQVLAQAAIDEEANILSVNLRIARERLLRHPWIKDARVSRVLPSELDITITEHRPFALIDFGEKFLVDTRGEIFKKWDASDPDHLPLISGLEFADFHRGGTASGKVFDSVMAVLQLGRSPDSIMPNRLISKIQVDPELGITLYAFDETKAIILGYNDYPGKYRTLEKVFSYLKQSPGISDFTQIDLNDRDRVILHPVRDESAAGNHKEV